MPGLPGDLRRWALEIAQVTVSAILLFVVIDTWAAQPFVVEMHSMDPTISAGDHVLIDKLSPRWDEYARGEIVVFDAPAPYDADGIPYVKRVIALPGERVQLENGRVYVTGADGLTTRLPEEYLPAAVRTLPTDPSGTGSWTLAGDELFVLGDNRAASVDSRRFGPIERDRIRGRAWLRYLPLDRIGIVGGA